MQTGSGEETELATQVVEGTALFEELCRAIGEERVRVVVECGNAPRIVMISEPALARLEGRGLAPPEEVRLSERETEVLRLAATGRTAEQVAAELGVARNTVVQHLAAVRRKLGVRTTRAAVERARAAGVLR